MSHDTVTELQQEIKRLHGQLDKLQFYHDFYEHAPDMILSVDGSSGRILDCNQTTADNLGYPKEELVGQPVFNFYTPESCERAKKLLTVFQQEGKITNAQLTLVRRDNTELTISLNASAVRDSTGTILHSRSIWHDITQQKQLEEGLRRAHRAAFAFSRCNKALLASESESQLLNDISRIIVYDCEYRLAWVGLAMDNMEKTVFPAAQAGYEKGYLSTLHLTWSDTPYGQGPTGTAIRTMTPCAARHISTDPQYAPWREEAMKRGYGSSLALPLLCENQCIGALNIYAKEPDAFDEQETDMLLELANSIAFGIIALRARKKKEAAEKTLHKQEMLLRTMGRIAKIGAWEFDPQSGHGSWTEEVARIHESAVDCEADMDFILSFYHGSYRKALEHVLNRAIETGTPYDLELEMTTPAGHQKWVRTLGQCSGQCSGDTEIDRTIIGSFQDITELKKIETELRSLNRELERRVTARTAQLTAANEKLKELDRLKSMFIASMSHELRTPLNSIIGFSSIIREEWLGPVNEEQKENLTSILFSGKHLLALINDIIDLSKVEAGTLDENPEVFDLHDLILQGVKNIERQASDKELEVIVDSSPLVMTSDRRRLLQCLMNLLSNSVKFTDKGSIRVRTRILSLDGEGDTVELSVQDSGLGIRQEDITRLFAPFVRLHPPNDVNFPGTGLGLYLTDKLVREVLHGQILLESRYGKGSTFSLRIPRNPPDRQKDKQ